MATNEELLSRWIIVGAILLALGVAFGAFGAHALKGKLDTYAVSVYEKAVLYHLVHAVGIISVCALSASGLVSAPAVARICCILTFGVLIFSGSLYVLSVSGIRWLGAITPIGGTAFIAAWILLAYEAYKTGSASG